MATVIVVFGICGIGLVVGLAVRVWMEDRRNQNAFWAHSNQLGMDLKKFHVFTRATRPVLTPIKRGTSDDPDLTAFRFRYQIPHGKRLIEVSLTVVYAHCLTNRVPNFAIQPETPLLTADVRDLLFGTRVIDFESHPEFSRQYQLRGGDETAIRQLFNPDVLEFFETHPGLSVEAIDNQMIYYRRNTTVLPNDLADEIKDLLKEARELRSCFGVASTPDP